jgi:hypothetical protein
MPHCRVVQVCSFISFNPHPLLINDILISYERGHREEVKQKKEALRQQKKEQTKLNNERKKEEQKEHRLAWTKKLEVGILSSFFNPNSHQHCRFKPILARSGGTNG